MTYNAQRRPGGGVVTDPQQANRITAKPTGPTPDVPVYDPAGLLDQLWWLIAQIEPGHTGPAGRAVTGWDNDRFLAVHLILVDYGEDVL